MPFSYFPVQCGQHLHSLSLKLNTSVRRHYCGRKEVRAEKHCLDRQLQRERECGAVCISFLVGRILLRASYRPDSRLITSRQGSSWANNTTASLRALPKQNEITEPAVFKCPFVLWRSHSFSEYIF